MDAFPFPYQPDNPTDSDRKELLLYILKRQNRLEDFENIIELLSPPQEITTICPPGAGKDIKVAVIGAGLAGLSSAFELRKLGCHITIFEAKDRIGGRIYTYYFDKEKNLYGELGAMRIPVSHETTWHYINLFKLKTYPFINRNVNGIFYLRGRHAKNDEKGESVKKNIYPAFRLSNSEKNTSWQNLVSKALVDPLKRLPVKIREEILELKNRYSPQMVQLDMFSLRQIFETAGLTQEAIEMLGYLDTLDATFFYNGYSELLHEVYTADFAFTYTIEGGLLNLPLAFFKSLIDEYPHGYSDTAKKHLGKVIYKNKTPVTGIMYNKERKTIIIEYSANNKAEKFYQEFDYVICAIPFSSLARIKLNPLFSSAKMQTIRELNYAVGQKTFIYFKHRFWENGDENSRIIGGSSSTDLPIISIFYPSDHAEPVPGKIDTYKLRGEHSPKEPGVLLASYNWEQYAIRLGSLEPERKFYDIKRYVEKVHDLPEYSLDKIALDFKSILWSEEPYIWGGVCWYKPEQKRIFSYAIIKPEYNEQIFFAGEHASTKHGWQQGALQSGMIAANLIARKIKRKKYI